MTEDAGRTEEQSHKEREANQSKHRRREPSFLGVDEDGRDLFGLAAHKLHVPLSTIRGFVSTLLQRGDELDSETVHQFLQLILVQTDRLQGLLRDFLLLARISGSIEVVNQPFPPRAVIQFILDELDDYASERIQVEGDLDLEVVGDAELVMSALRPLVENSLLYGPRLEFVTITVSTEGESTHWEVRDRGRRLSTDKLQGLFLPFRRADEPVERRGSGAGLGLVLARGYARMLGGWVEGRVDDLGTVFWLDVPKPGATVARSTSQPVESK